MMGREQHEARGRERARHEEWLCRLSRASVVRVFLPRSPVIAEETHPVERVEVTHPVERIEVADQVFMLQEGWFCVVGGRVHGTWCDRGAALAGMLVEQQRAHSRRWLRAEQRRVEIVL